MDETAMEGPHETLDPADQVDDSPEPANPNATGDPDVDAALELVMSTFADEDKAKAAYAELREAEKQELVLLVDAALVARDHEGNLSVQEEGDMRAGPGALWGGGIGAIIGMVGGPLGVVLGGAAGAAIGGSTAEAHDAGMIDARLKEFAANVGPDSAMVFAAVAHYWSGIAAAFLTRAGGQTQTILLADDVAGQLNTE
ncbi:MAG TPA: hypothetical protein VLQ48_08940 [Chloroflexia bacterium]|nr:hypothetical protein [Chloroflexia bacterium]